jgi:hypothetical protein
MLGVSNGMIQAFQMPNYQRFSILMAQMRDPNWLFHACCVA